jgi:hypothetical protein
MSLRLQVGYPVVLYPDVIEGEKTLFLLGEKAADLSVMLALMAGRNAGQMIDLVKGNQVNCFPLQSEIPRHLFPSGQRRTGNRSHSVVPS